MGLTFYCSHTFGKSETNSRGHKHMKGKLQPLQASKELEEHADRRKGHQKRRGITSGTTRVYGNLRLIRYLKTLGIRQMGGKT